MSFNENQYFAYIKRMNNRAIPEFEGYSPEAMYNLLYYPYSPQSPLSLIKLSEEDYASIPLLNLVRHLMKTLEQNGETKLTARGFLPQKIVFDMYAQGFYKDYLIDSGITKLAKEEDALSINLTHILTIMTGIVKKRNNKISLTKKGTALLDNDQSLLQLLFETFTVVFNWAYYDDYESEDIGRIGFGFSLFLLGKYGAIKRSADFYADKYFKAFPDIRNDYPNPGYSTREKVTANCYKVRSFNRFLDYFGLITIETRYKNFEKFMNITKTPLFDKLIHCRNPKLIL